ncbi:MAG: hypothetical protein ACOYS2_03170, partial [Patescibacteria group bacterium]
MRNWINFIFRMKRIRRGAEIEDSIMTITEKEKALIEKPLKRKGLSIFWLFISLSLVLLLARVSYLVFIEGERYSDISKNNRIRKMVIKAPRGEILDKFGH